MFCIYHISCVVVRCLKHFWGIKYFTWLQFSRGNVVVKWSAIIFADTHIDLVFCALKGQYFLFKSKSLASQFSPVVKNEATVMVKNCKYCYVQLIQAITKEGGPHTNN